MNSNDPGQTAPSRTQALRNLAALIQDAAGQHGPEQHITWVQNALLALRTPLLHLQWLNITHNVTTTQKAAHDSAQQAELARQEGQPANDQQIKRNRARDDAGKANAATREQAQFEDDVVRKLHEAFAQLSEQQGAPVYHPVPLAGHENATMNVANPNMPPPEQEPTITHQLDAIHHLTEEYFVRAHRRGEEMLEAIRATNHAIDEQSYNQRMIMELLREIRDQNRGGAGDLEED